MATVSVKAVIAVAVLLVGGGAVSASAERDRSSSLRAELEGAQEVPAVSTEASGSFKARIHREGDKITYRLRYRDLSGAVQQAHIHFGQRNVNGGVSAFLCSNLDGAPDGTPACPQEGTVRGTIEADDVVGPAAQGIAAGELDELVAAIRDGLAYANVHTEPFPAGEIRGQIKD